MFHDQSPETTVHFLEHHDIEFEVTTIKQPGGVGHTTNIKSEGKLVKMLHRPWPNVRLAREMAIRWIERNIV